MTYQVVYDTEFIDNGLTIEPLAIGMLGSDGAELYAVTDSLPTLARAAENYWLLENVLPHLPVTIKWITDAQVDVSWNADHPEYECVKPLEEIAEDVEDFIRAMPDPQLWAYYAAYDHVLYAQLFGAMSDLPNGLPQYTLDVKQEAVRLGDPPLPKLSSAAVEKRFDGVRKPHHALYDAYEEAEQLAWLRTTAV